MLRHWQLTLRQVGLKLERFRLRLGGIGSWRIQETNPKETDFDGSESSVPQSSSSFQDPDPRFQDPDTWLQDTGLQDTVPVSPETWSFKIRVMRIRNHVSIPTRLKWVYLK